MRSVVLLSGGIDSTTALELAMQESEKVACLSFEYGQRHDRETVAAERVANYYGVTWDKVRVPMYMGESILMDPKKEMPHRTYQELSEMEGPSPTYVPFRNGTFLSIAAGYALHYNCDTIWAGMHGEDAHNFAYPDCTPEFIGAMQNAIYVGTYHKVRLTAPFSYLTKAQVVGVGLTYGVPYQLTWSCYEGRDYACGKCPTCVGRLEAFKKNNAVDPIIYDKESLNG